ncbi:MAG: DUF2493 domain-containing protein [Planctomycetota bacterium]|nr:MAG: DUF2493 domain-containing protein [Planctomycetota bacterium]
MPMKVIIAGSRGIADKTVLNDAIQESGFAITEVVSGCAKGVDKLGEEWATENNIPIKRFKTRWVHRGSGLDNNKKMIDYADAAIILWDGVSKGTKHMIQSCQNTIPTFTVELSC